MYVFYVCMYHSYVAQAGVVVKCNMEWNELRCNARQCDTGTL